MAIASGGIPDQKDFRAARLAVVEEHVRLENAHDLEGILRTFGSTARYDDEAWGEHFEGSSGVRSFYEQLMAALPDLLIDVQRRHLTDDSIVLEVIIRGTHLGPWRGLPATGRKLEIPLCGVYTFDADDRLAGEKIYYDRGTALRQLGVFHEPESLLGRAFILLTHPPDDWTGPGANVQTTLRRSSPKQAASPPAHQLFQCWEPRPKDRAPLPSGLPRLVRRDAPAAPPRWETHRKFRM